MKKDQAYRIAKFKSDLIYREESIKLRENELSETKIKIIEDKIKETQKLTRYKQAIMDLLEDKEGARKKALFLIEEEI